MTLGIVTSSIADFYLLRILREFDVPFHVWYDQEGGDRGDKEEGYVRGRVEMGMQYLIDAGATHIILSPIRELVYREDLHYGKYILPLFWKYMTQVCLPASRVGKIGFVGEYGDCRHQSTLQAVLAGHTLTEKQSTTKSFHQPFAVRCKQVSMWKQFLVTLGFRDWMMHNVVKHDCHYLLDASIDTFIPLQYGFFAYEATIAKLFRTKKCHLHRSASLVEIVRQHLSDARQGYALTVSYTGTNTHLLAEKKRVWILQRGIAIDIVWKKI